MQILNQLTELSDYFDSFGLPSLWNLLWAIIVVFAGRWLARRSRIWFKQAVGRLDLTINESILRLTEAIIYYGIFLLAVILSLALLGIPIDSILLILVGTIIFLAIILQPSLSNMAATIIFITFQTYKQGDWIEVMDTFGQVKELQMFSTVVVTLDQRTVIIPNGEILQNEITNYSELGLRRIDLTFTVLYQDDLHRAKQILQDVVDKEPRILAEPKAVIGIWDLGDKGAEFTVRPYVEITDYTLVKIDLNERVKFLFDDAGIKIPIPQQDVHLINQN